MCSIALSWDQDTVDVDGSTKNALQYVFHYILEDARSQGYTPYSRRPYVYIDHQILP